MGRRSTRSNELRPSSFRYLEAVLWMQRTRPILFMGEITIVDFTPNSFSRFSSTPRRSGRWIILWTQLRNGRDCSTILGEMADRIGIEKAYELCSFLPLVGLQTLFLPRITDSRTRHPEEDNR